VYQIEAWSAVRTAWREPRIGDQVSTVSFNVIALGLTSLLTDVSSEMIASILPLFLVTYLGLTPMHLGMIDGLSHAATALLRIAGGWTADRFDRCKPVAAAGYAISLAARALLLIGQGALAVAAGLAIDRLGKGIRTAPRDVLIALSSRQERLGVAFGVHRAMDGAGAMLGPLLAMAVLAAVPGGFDVVFVTSVVFGACGLAALLLLVRERPRTAATGTPSRHGDETDPAAAGLRSGRERTLLVTVFGVPPFRRLTAAAVLLSLMTIGDGLLYLLLQRRSGLSGFLLPAMYVGTSVSYAILAQPGGRLADAIGHNRAFIAGHVLLTLVYVAAIFSSGRPGVAIGCVLGLGGYYALTDGVAAAAAAGVLPRRILGTGLACLSTATSLGRLGASVMFGALWTYWGGDVALVWCAAGLASTAAASAWLIRRQVVATSA
jgi:MFS family permease